jgi:hypothetical protein
MRTINCHNTAHLGDCIQTLHFLIRAVETNDVCFNFSCNPIYHNQLSEFIKYHSDKIKLLNLIQSLHQESIDTWVAGYGDYAAINDKCVDAQGFIDQSLGFLIHWFRMANTMQINCPFKCKDDLIYDESILQEQALPDNYDYLFINSFCLSLEYDNFETEGLDFINRIKQSGKSVITTRKIQDIPCTLDYNLSVVKIGQLSKNVKTIVGSNTGPIHLCMNKWSLSNIDKFIVWSPSHNFNFGPKFKTVKSLHQITDKEI